MAALLLGRLQGLLYQFNAFAQCLGDATQYVYAGGIGACLDSGDVRLCHAAFLGKLGLGEASLLAEFLDALTDLFCYFIHCCLLS